MPLFNVPNRASNKSQDKSIAQRTKKKPTTTIRSGGLLGKINAIKDMVERNLGEYKEEYEVIRTTDHLQGYLMTCYSDGVVAIDTETTGLDPLVDTCVGISLYSPSNKPAYIPINHISYVTGVRVEEQLTAEQVAFELKGLEQAQNNKQMKIIMFNAKFDIRVIRRLGVYLTCNWDCYLAAKLMNENEPTTALKPLHKKYVLENKKDAFTFDELFKGITFDKIPINVGYLYAAHDAIITYELYEYQKQYLYYDSSETKEARNAMNGVAWVFENIEMPCVNVVADMEDIGILFDMEYRQELSTKYNAILEEKKAEFYNFCDMFADKIEQYKLKHRDCKLDNPINISSPVQIACLLYDVLQVEPVDVKKPRGTGEDVLVKISAENTSEIASVCKAILEYREVEKLVSTYIDKLPACVNKNDGRIHCSFNQYGAVTGRFSSSNPNLQNIPSHNKDIRKMFKASDDYVLMSSDYSQQEPKVMTQMCGDPKMIEAYKAGKDLYSEIASLSFNTTYENCLEFNDDGTTNKEGKERRSQAKSILLGVLYGRGVPSIAEQLNVSTEKAQAIKDSVFKGFPAIPKFEEDSLDMAYEKGYVTTLWGRKRRLPDLSLDEYEFRWKDGAPPDDDLLDFDFMPKPEIQEIPKARINYYLRKLNKAWGKEKRRIFEEANAEGIWIVDNGGKIADAERQVVNSRIQGSAADMSKLAMILVGNDERLKELGFRLLIPVHDELIAECPEEHALECKERFAMLMAQAAESALEIPISCDVELTRCWYGEKVKI